MARAGEPTEAPTARRLEQARRRGEVAFSRDLTSAAGTAAAFAALALGGPALIAWLLAYQRTALRAATAGGDAAASLAGALAAGAHLLAPPLAAASAVALGVGLLQTRGLVALGPLAPDLGRLSPAAGLRRLAGGRAALEVGRGLLKGALVAALAWATLRPALGALAASAGAPAPRVLALLGLLARTLGGRVVLAALALGLADFLFTWRRHHRQLRMTRDEVRRERKESEGDPAHRAERQRLHRELAEQRMLAEVRKADFVVVNPHHIAVALRYDREGGGAPVVVASGERLAAERIKQLAREAGVPIFRDVTLARSLAEIAEGGEIPAALYEAVAEILRVVYAMEAAPPSASAPSSGIDGGAGWKRV